MTSVLHKDLMVWQRDVLSIRRKELDLPSGDVCSRLESAYYTVYNAVLKYREWYGS